MECYAYRIGSPPLSGHFFTPPSTYYSNPWNDNLNKQCNLVNSAMY